MLQLGGCCPRTIDCFLALLAWTNLCMDTKQGLKSAEFPVQSKPTIHLGVVKKGTYVSFNTMEHGDSGTVNVD